jgi:acyl-CoA reductase-like NAD-dependent aldehyde dehydrogenase
VADSLSQLSAWRWPATAPGLGRADLWLKFLVERAYQEPAAGEKLAVVAEAQAEDVDRAVQAAKKVGRHPALVVRQTVVCLAAPQKMKRLNLTCLPTLRRMTMAPGHA